jgi:hypothetical protein
MQEFVPIAVSLTPGWLAGWLAGCAVLCCAVPMMRAALAATQQDVPPSQASLGRANFEYELHAGAHSVTIEYVDDFTDTGGGFAWLEWNRVSGR